MADLMGMMKQAAAMRKEMKQVQKQLGRQTVEAKAANGRVTVTARCDMTIAGVSIDDSLIETGDRQRIEKFVTVGVNSALAAAKKKAGREMASLTQGMEGGGLGSLLGG